MATLRRVFLDFGGTLVDEEAFHRYMYETILSLLRKNGLQVADEEFERKWWELITWHTPFSTRRLIESFCKNDALKEKVYWEYRGLVKGKDVDLYSLWPGTLSVLEELKRSYPLGLVANQYRTIRGFFERHHLQDYFDVIIISDEVGVSKPDKRIYELALKWARCSPSEAVMVGDRIDNDVAPASSLGMRTVRIRIGTFSRQDPRSAEEIPDAEIRDIRELPKVLASFSNSENEK